MKYNEIKKLESKKLPTIERILKKYREDNYWNMTPYKKLVESCLYHLIRSRTKYVFTRKQKLESKLEYIKLLDQIILS